MLKLLKIAKEEDPRRAISTRSWRRRIPGAAGGRSFIDHAASTQSVIFNKKIYEHIYVRLEKIHLSIYLTLTFCPKFFPGFSTCILPSKKILGQNVNVKFFTVAP